MGKGGAAPGGEGGEAVEAVTVEHGFTHRVWVVHVFAATGTPSGGEATVWRAVSEAELADRAGPALCGPALKALRACGVAVPFRRGAGRRGAKDNG